MLPLKPVVRSQRDWVESRLGFRNDSRQSDTDMCLPQLGDNRPSDQDTINGADNHAGHFSTKFKNSMLKSLPVNQLSNSQFSAPPPPLVQSSIPDMCDTCSDNVSSAENGRRKPTPDLLELSNMYENLHRQTIMR